MNITVIYGSVRSDRQGIKAARFIMNKLNERNHHVNFIDPMEYKLPLLDKMYKEYSENDAPDALIKMAGIYKNTDAFIIVTGEYNHSIPPALKNLLDHFLEEYFWRPSAIVSYSAGGFGGVRAAVHLRAILAELGMSSIPSIFAIGKVHDVFTDDGKTQNEGYNTRVIRFLDELEWHAEALKNQREKGVPY